jgi:hypothetical protein
LTTGGDIASSTAVEPFRWRNHHCQRRLKTEQVPTVESAGAGAAVHPGADHVAQDRPFCTAFDGAVDGSGHGWWQRDEHDFAVLGAYPQHSVAVLLAQIGDARSASFEDP